MTPSSPERLSIREIVENGLCIGCGLCAGITGPQHLKMVLTPEGRERPVAVQPLSIKALDTINAVCPGRRVPGADPGSRSDKAVSDLIWGTAEQLAIGHASDPDVRRRASTGGILSALGQFLLSSGRVQFILHVGASRSHPMRTQSRLSFDAASVLSGAGSRYGPTAPLADFESVLARREAFALIGKPCDIAAVRNFASHDERVNRYMSHALSFSCGGASDLTKSELVLAQLGVEERDVSLFRYRGNGNPGPTRVETRDGRSFELTYSQMWEDENTWMIQPRCKICPDPIGESADLVAADVWPGGGPSGEDEGFNGIIVRTRAGLDLYEAAVSAGAITVTPRTLTFRDLDALQPHQLRKRRAMWARYSALRRAGRSVPETPGLRLQECSRLNAPEENTAEQRNTVQRLERGRLSEPPAVERSEGE